MYLSVPFIMENFKKINSVDPDLWQHFWEKMANLPQMRIFFSGKPLIQVPCTLWSLSLCKLQSCEDVYFQTQNVLFARNKTFFTKTMNIISMYPLASFIVQKVRKILRPDPKVTRMHHFFQFFSQFSSVSLSENRYFSENKLLNLVAIIQLCLHAKNQSQM